MPGTIAIGLIVTGVITFIFILTILPGDAYGDEDIRVFSEVQVQARARTQILVLGDIGRSPRMQYHAISIARLGKAVDLIGYVDSELHPDIIALKKQITVHPISQTPKWLRSPSKTMFPFLALLRVLYQFAAVYAILANGTKPAKFLILQNPPAIPTLLLARIIAFLRKTAVIIDWHNLSYSILSLKLGPEHRLVKISKWHEKAFSNFARANLTVTDAMAKKLKRDFGVTTPILTFRDRPSQDFQPRSASQRLDFLRAFSITAPHIDAIEKGKLKVLVSSTSWTADEDFSILLDALVAYSALATSSRPNLPEILVIITGKGPEQASYISKIAALKAQDKLEMASVVTTWLPTDIYAGLLASADLGLSLHTSSSGVDLPMKVVDMFGSGLPVAAWSDFEAWEELGKEGINSMGFKDAKSLEKVLVELLGGDGKTLEVLRKGALEESKQRWAEQWEANVGKMMGFV